ncbi:hypothetical protein LCGC14_0632310, partial [marine sediment metagenome]
MAPEVNGDPLVTLTNVSLFTGYGGDVLAAEAAGIETVAFVENVRDCRRVLRKHWPETKQWKDIRDVKARDVMAYAQGWQQSKLKESDNTSHPQERYESRASDRSGRGNITAGIKHRRGVAEAISSTAGISPITIISGGFPCQPVSHAGKQRGKEDDRWLWPEMLRLISEIRPTWVVAENVAGIIGMGLDGVLSDLESAGFETLPLLIPACAV